MTKRWQLKMAVVSMGLFLFVLASGPVMAAEGKVFIESLKIGGKAVGDEVKKTIFYKQLLPGGKIYVSGRAVSRDGELASVEVTRDGKKTWRKASLSSEGFFEYSFRPKADETYDICVKATTKKGETGNIADTCTEVRVSEKNIYSLVRETLDEVVEAYENHNLRSLMSFFSEDFYGDKDMLDRALRNGASLYHDVDVRVILNSVVPDYSDKIFASVTFNRRYTVIRTGQTTTDGGTTAFILRFENGQLKIVSMTRPLIFLQ